MALLEKAGLAVMTLLSDAPTVQSRDVVLEGMGKARTRRMRGEQRMRRVQPKAYAE
jgi:hypothetical protein